MALHSPQRFALRLAIMVPAVFLLLIGQAVSQGLSRCPRPRSGCNCPGCRAYFEAVEGVAPGTSAEGTSPDQLSAAAPLDQSSLLAADVGAAAGAAGAVPTMIGDFFGNNYEYAFMNPEGTTVATAGGARRFKYAENTNPFPTNRVFFNYNYFDDPLLDVNGHRRDFNMFTFGIEKAFCEDLFSVELRVPFAAALDSQQNINDPNQMATEFGNVTLAGKVMLYQRERTAVAAGLAVVFPTGNDSVVTDGESTVIIFENSSVFLQPFIGFYNAPTERLFHQFIAQVDFDATGSDVIIPADSFLSINESTDQVANLQSQSLLYLDYQVGYWLRRDPCAAVLTGVAPLLELHYTSTLQNLDLGPFGTEDRGSSRGIFVENLRRDVLNLTSGVYFELFQRTSVKLAAVAPLLEDRMFDYEMCVQISHRY